MSWRRWGWRIEDLFCPSSSRRGNFGVQIGLVANFRCCKCFDQSILLLVYRFNWLLPVIKCTILWKEIRLLSCVLEWWKHLIHDVTQTCVSEMKTRGENKDWEKRRKEGKRRRKGKEEKEERKEEGKRRKKKKKKVDVSWQTHWVVTQQVWVNSRWRITLHLRWLESLNQFQLKFSSMINCKYPWQWYVHSTICPCILWEGTTI